MSVTFTELLHIEFLTEHKLIVWKTLKLKNDQSKLWAYLKCRIKVKNKKRCFATFNFWPSKNKLLGERHWYIIFFFVHSKLWTEKAKSLKIIGIVLSSIFVELFLRLFLKRLIKEVNTTCKILTCCIFWLLNRCFTPFSHVKV